MTQANVSRYCIRHETVYRYNENVSRSHHLLALQPREMPHQRLISTHLAISPQPDALHSYDDWFGNRVTALIIQETHRDLTITATSTVEVDSVAMVSKTMPWEDVLRWLDTPTSDVFSAVEYRLASPLVPIDPSFAAFARDDFTVGRDFIQAIESFITRIYTICTYDPSATTVNTPVSDVLKHQRGVCQDFAHLALAGLRSLGFSARYVSGYLETDPPIGQPRLRGADASHAWLEVWCPMVGWLAFDPTNGCRVLGDRHITCAWGRDFADISPVRGVILGGGAHDLAVSVDVERIV